MQRFVCPDPGRSVERLPNIDNLWNRGLTDENNEGYVTARSSLNSTEMAWVQEENRDRQTLYAYIAHKTGAAQTEAGRLRAIQMTEMAKSGLWVQTEAGKWTRKKSMGLGICPPVKATLSK